jgi:hypothetical protein
MGRETWCWCCECFSRIRWMVRRKTLIFQNNSFIVFCLRYCWVSQYFRKWIVDLVALCRIRWRDLNGMKAVSTRGTLTSKKKNLFVLCQFILL